MSDAITNAAIALAHAIAATAQMQMNSASNVAAPTPTPTPAADPFGGLVAQPTPTPTPVEVTPKMVQELIMPLIADEAKKAKLAAAMQSMGITELPAAKPEQLPELYAKFKAIADEGAGTPTPASGGTATII